MGAAPGNSQIVDETIHGIYGSITNYREWPQVLRNIDIITKSSCSTLISAKRQDRPISNISSTIDGRRFTEYQTTLMSKDNVARHVRSLNPGILISSSDFLGIDGARQSTVYEEFYAECGFLHFLGSNLVMSDMDWIGIVCFRGPGSAPYEQDDRDIFGQIVPHMLRSMQISQYAAEKESAAETAVFGFDSIHHAAFILDRNYRMLSSNRTGRALIHTGDIGVDDDGRLDFMPGGAPSMIRRQALVAPGCRNVGNSSIVRISGGRRLAITVTNMTESEDTNFSFSNEANHIVLVFDVDARFKAVIEDVCREFSLTPAEKRIYEASLYQSNSCDIAEALGLSRETVRTHLKNIYSKVGASRHVDLVQNFIHRTPPGPHRFVN